MTRGHEGPAEPPDWNARYKGYAFRQLVNTADVMERELDRDVLSGKLAGADLARAEARLHSYTTLIECLQTLKELQK